MRGRLLVLTVAAAAGFSTGCSTMAGTGALAGGGIGAGTGALIGAATGSPEAGAAIGGVLGAGVGAAVGADADQRAQDRADIRRVQAEAAAAHAPGPMSVDDVIAMCRPGPTGTRPADETIIEYIRTSGSRFDLTPADIRMLSDNAVPDPVVRAMMNTKHARPAVVRRGAPTTVIVDEPPPVVVYERPWGYRRPYYYVPPPPIGFGFSYTRVR
jgi:hypothetical protein